ncbi:Leucine-rich repeat receptor-like serine/threonine-protein kinase BAM1 [Dendrobium catenatum]|uniref:Leucine-rich repeat receptor-like serine/threonine-protein kinase BAM1 n=1 Tax=Dendrobium catenatum TaxID=906689 RepID=A0A2I0V6M7_9ASPA|nr:Leucine-rich repeat receptor-like serine/threonine-protein kinase BAM1 [Dendrobium catenatum]
MDCGRRSAVDDDRSRKTRLAVDDDRRQGRWAVDDARSRIAFYQAQSKKSLDQVDRNLDRIRENLWAIRKMRMSSATIPRYSSSSSISSSVSRRCYPSRHTPPVVDDYAPLELPLKWCDPPPEYPPLELPLQWRNPPPPQITSPRKRNSDLDPIQLDSALIDASPRVGYSPNPSVTGVFRPPELSNPHDGIPITDIQPDPTAATPPLPSAQTELPHPHPLCSRNLALGVEPDLTRSNSSSASALSLDRPADLSALQATRSNPPTPFYALVTDGFHHPIQLPPPDLAASNVVNMDDGSAPITPVQAHPTTAEGILQHNAHRQSTSYAICWLGSPNHTSLSFGDNHSHGNNIITVVATASGDKSNDEDRVQLLLTKILKPHIRYFKNYKGWIQLEIVSPRKLVRLEKACCGCTDDISYGIGKLENHDTILLQVNGLAGEPPLELRQLRSLKSKDLSNNAFMAETPPSFVGLNKRTLLTFGAWSLSSSSDSSENKS